MITTPDKWTILKFTSEEHGEIYKIFGSWSGGYLHGQSWKANSGIKSIEETDTHYLFHGFSGSVYECHKKMYGVTTYGAGVLEAFEDQLPMEILEEEEAQKYIDNL